MVSRKPASRAPLYQTRPDSARGIQRSPSQRIFCIAVHRLLPTCSLHLPPCTSQKAKCYNAARPRRELRASFDHQASLYLTRVPSLPSARLPLAIYLSATAWASCSRCSFYPLHNIHIASSQHRTGPVLSASSREAIALPCKVPHHGRLPQPARPSPRVLLALFLRPHL